MSHHVGVAGGLGSSARASSAGLAFLFLFNSISHLPLLRDLSQSPGPLLLWQVNFLPLFVTFQQLWIILVRHAWVGCKWTRTWGGQRQPQVQSGTSSFTSFETRSLISGELTNDSSLAGPSFPKFGMGQQTQHFYVGSGDSNLDLQAKGLYPRSHLPGLPGAREIYLKGLHLG